MIELDDITGSKQLLKTFHGQTHYIDIRVRFNGKYYWFEGDWLKEIFKKIKFRSDNNEPSVTLEQLEEI